MAILTEINSVQETIIMQETAQSVKEHGNEYFKTGEYEKAICSYTKALSLDKGDGPNLNVYRKNKAACFLKLQRFQEAIAECTKVLEVAPGDPKGLFRRCQAYEASNDLEHAYKDAVLLAKLDPTNSAVLPIIQRLNPVIQRKVQNANSTSGKVSGMFEIAFDSKMEIEKRNQAANNLIVLAREPSGAERIFNEDVGFVHLKRLLKDAAPQLRLAAIRVFACIADNSKSRALAVLNSLTLKIICIQIGSACEDTSTAGTHLLKNIINSITSINLFCKERDEYETKRTAEPNSRMRAYPFVCEKIDPEGHKHLDYVFPALITMLGHCKVSQYGRDSVMELILKFVTRRDGAGWSKKFIEAEGLQRLMEVAGTVPEHKTLLTSVNTRMHASLCLSRIYDDLMSDKERELYKDSVNLYFNDMFGDQIMESKLEAVMAMAALLQGPIEVGNMILAREGVVEILLAMTEGGNPVHVKYAIEALVHATSKKNRCSGIIKEATPILKHLYTNSNDAVKVRALVGLCKLGSFGGGDASSKTYADGSTQTLSKACRKFLMNVDKDVDIRKWAAEGLAYLTLDADVKDELCNDTNAVNSLLDLAKIKDKGILYPVAQILVNCTNSYDKIEVEKELVELAKFSKQHVPEDHEKDGEKFVKLRVEKLLKTGVVNALVLLSTTDSESSRENLSRVYLALVMDPLHRGLIVQQGGAKALIPLANIGNFVGKAIAAQALCKISITQDPNISFPGQRVYEVIRPILQLLQVEKTALQNFEALMALTNLSCMSDSVRMRIIKDGGIPWIEHYLYEEHPELKRAATECFCNLVMHEQVAELFVGENDRVKLMVLFCGDEDPKVVMAASGCLATLSDNPKICEKIVTVTKQWKDHLQQLLLSDDPAVQHRGAYIVRNLASQSKELADVVLEGDFFKVLMALTKTKTIKDNTLELINDALKNAVKFGLIQPINNQ